MKNSVRITGGDLKGKRFLLTLKALLGPHQVIKRFYLIGYNLKQMALIV